MLTAIKCVPLRICARVIMTAIIKYRQVRGHALTTITTGIPTYLGILALPGPHHSKKGKLNPTYWLTGSMISDLLCCVD